MSDAAVFFPPHDGDALAALRALPVPPLWRGSGGDDFGGWGRPGGSITVGPTAESGDSSRSRWFVGAGAKPSTRTPVSPLA